MNLRDPQQPCAVSDTNALGSSLLPSVISVRVTVYTRTHTHTRTAWHANTLARINCTGKQSDSQCSHARLLADGDKRLFLPRPHWGDTKEHLLLPVKLYCMQVHSHCHTHKGYLYTCLTLSFQSLLQCLRVRGLPSFSCHYVDLITSALYVSIV